MSVIVNLSQKPDDEFRRGLKELSGMPLTTKDFSLLTINDSYGKTDTKIKIRSATQSTLITGEIDRLYTRINITDYLKQLTNDPRIHIYGWIADDTEESGWDKTKKLVYKTLNGDFKINFSIDDLTIVKEGDVFYAEIENLSMTGKAEIYQANDKERTSIKVYLKSDLSTTLYKNSLHPIAVDINSSDQMAIDIAKTGNNVDLTGCEIEQRRSDQIRIHVPYNHPQHLPEWHDVYYSRLNLQNRMASVYNNSGVSTTASITFFYPKPYDEIKSEDYPDIRKALNEQFQLAIGPDDTFTLSSPSPNSDGTTDVKIRLNENHNLIFTGEGKLRWTKPKADLAETFPEERLDMYGGVK